MMGIPDTFAVLYTLKSPLIRIQEATAVHILSLKKNLEVFLRMDLKNIHGLDDTQIETFNQLAKQVSSTPLLDEKAEKIEISSELKQKANGPLAMINLLVKEHEENVFKALNYLQQTLNVLSKEKTIQEASELLKLKIRGASILFNAQEAAILSSALKEVGKQSVFLQVLSDHFKYENLSLYKEAWECLYDLSEELKSLQTDEKIKEKFKAFYTENRSVSYLPSAAYNYLTALQSYEVFDRFPFRAQQIEVLTELNSAFRDFIQFKDNAPSQVVLYAKITAAKDGIYNPSSLVDRVKKQSPPFFKEPDEQKILKEPPKEAAPKQDQNPSFLWSMLQSALADSSINAAQEKPGSLDKIIDIIQRLSSFTPLVQELIPILNNLTSEKKDGKDALDKINTIADKLAPYGELIKKLTSFFPKTNEDKKGANDPSSKDPEKKDLPADATALDDFLVTAGNIFQKISTAAAGALSKKAIEKFSYALLWGLGKAGEFAKDKAEYQTAFVAIEDAIKKVNTATQTATWGQIGDAIFNCLGAVNKHQIYIYGCKMPRLGGSDEIRSNSIPIFADNIKALNKGPNTPLGKEDYDILIESEKQDFIRNTGSFLALKVLYESKFVCGLIPPDENFYFRMLEESRKGSPAESKSALKTLFFTKLDQAHTEKKILLTTKLVAKFLYLFLAPLTNFFIKCFSDRLIGDLKTTVKNGLSGGGNDIIKNFTRYLEVLSSTFERVAYEKNVSMLLPESIEKELKKNFANRGMDPTKLYKAVSKKASEKYAPKLEWSRGITTWIEKKKYLPTSFPKRLANLIFVIASSILRVFTFFPEKLVNAGLKQILRLIMVKNDIVGAIIEKSTSSLKNEDGYTHALNCVIYEQLSKILDLMKKAFADSSESFLLEDNLSMAKKKEFTTLVKNLFEVLPKGKCANRKELKDLIERTSPTVLIKETIDDFMVKDTVESSIRMIKIAHDSLMQKDQLEQQILNFLFMCNKSYKVGAKIPPHEFQAMEKGINDLSDKILTLAIHKSLEEKLDFSLKAQTEGSKKFIELLQKSTNDFSSELQKKITEMFNGVNWDHWKCRSLSEGLVSQSTEFQQKKINEQFEARSNQSFDTETKKKLDQYSEALAQQCKNLDQDLKAIDLAESDINLRQRIISDLNTLQQTFSTINENLRYDSYTIEGIVFCRSKIEEIKKILIQFPKVAHLQKGMIAKFSETIHHLSNHVNVLEYTRHNTFHLCSLNVNNPDSDLSKFIEEKKAQLNNPQQGGQDIKNKFNHNCNLIKKIEGIDQNVLMNSLTQIFYANSLQAVQEGLSQYRANWEQLWNFEMTRMHTTQSLIAQTQQFVVNEIQNSGENKADKIHAKVEETKHLLSEASKKIEALKTWTTTLKDIPVLNLSASDTTWLRDIAEELAYNHVKKRVEGLVEFLREPYNLYGTLHHVALIPFAENPKT